MYLSVEFMCNSSKKSQPNQNDYQLCMSAIVKTRQEFSDYIDNEELSDTDSFINM